MLQVYLKDEMDATQYDVSMAFIAYSLAFAMLSVPLGLVSARHINIKKAFHLDWK